MSLELDSYVTTKYTVVTIYEDGHKAYAVATTDKSVADDHVKRLKRGLFNQSRFGRAKKIFIIKRTTAVTKESMLMWQK